MRGIGEECGEVEGDWGAQKSEARINHIWEELAGEEVLLFVAMGLVLARVLDSATAQQTFALITKAVP